MECYRCDKKLTRDDPMIPICEDCWIIMGARWVFTHEEGAICNTDTCGICWPVDES